jgi:hypothetical protein
VLTDAEQLAELNQGKRMVLEQAVDDALKDSAE